MGFFNGNNDMPQATALTGNEQIPASTNLPNGQAPQDEVVTPALLRSFPIPPVTIPFSATPALNAAALSGTVGTMTLTGNTTLNLPAATGLAPGQKFSLELIQDATGNRTLTLTGAGVTVLRAGGTATLSVAASAVDLLDVTVVAVQNVNGAAATQILVNLTKAYA